MLGSGGGGGEGGGAYWATLQCELRKSGAYDGGESIVDVAISAIVCFAVSALKQRILLQSGTGWSCYSPGEVAVVKTPLLDALLFIKSCHAVSVTSAGMPVQDNDHLCHDELTVKYSI